jgi:hypothetical protein
LTPCALTFRLRHLADRDVMPINENQIEEADAAIEQAITTFVSEFASMWGRWEVVREEGLSH